MSERSWV